MRAAVQRRGSPDASLFIAKSFSGARAKLQRSGLSDAQTAKRLRALEARKAANEDKLERMVAYAQSSLCRWRTLLEYFEDPEFDATSAAAHATRARIRWTSRCKCRP